MSAELDQDVRDDSAKEFEQPCRVVCFYEQARDCDVLLQFCRALEFRYREEIEFQFEWWGFKFLAHPRISAEASKSTGRANVILMATRSPRLPAEVEGWLEDRLSGRLAEEGALVYVPGTSDPTVHQSVLATQLARIARAGGLDFIPVAAHGEGSYFSAMDELLRDPPPAHWGINE